MKVRVRNNDTLWYFSQLFNVPYKLLLSTNKQGRDGENVDYAVIPGYVLKRYTKKNDETLDDIAKHFQLPVDAIKLVNQNKVPSEKEWRIPVCLTKDVLRCNKDYDYQSMINDLKILKELYPFIEVETIGYSVLGNAIPHIKIGEGSKTIHFNGSFHANEWITSAILMNIVGDYLIALVNQQSLIGFDLLPFYEQFTLSIVPMVNPDGVDLVHHGPPDIEPYYSFVQQLNKGEPDYKDWKANIRGVDLNNQYPAKWEIEQRRKPKEPAPRDFPGRKPLTEPEAIAMKELAERYCYEAVVAYHTQGMEIYWDFLGREPENAERVVNELARISGYKPVAKLDSYAGYKDWFIYKWGRLGFTVELGDGVNPLPLSQYDKIYNESLAIFLAIQSNLL